MVNVLEAVILSVIQGITEWFPVSSSGHLAILHNLFGFQNLSFDVFLHFSSIFAIIFVFWKDIIKFLNIKNKENLKYILLIIIGIIPAALTGFLFKEYVEKLGSNFVYLGFFFIVSGILIYSTKFSKSKNEKITLIDSIFIGVFQIFAIFPGISRSGATISSGLFRGLKKETAVKFSFFMAIPLIFGAGIFEINDLVMSNISYPILLISFVLTFLISIFSIKILLKILHTDRFYLFGIYNFILGIALLIWNFIG